MCYRYNQVREWQNKLKYYLDYFTIKLKKYDRRIIVIDVIVYSVSAVVTGTGLVLSALTLTSPAVITICVSASTAIAEIFNTIAKKISTCANEKKYPEYCVKLRTVTVDYSELSQKISVSMMVLYQILNLQK